VAHRGDVPEPRVLIGRRLLVPGVQQHIGALHGLDLVLGRLRFGGHLTSVVAVLVVIYNSRQLDAILFHRLAGAIGRTRGAGVLRALPSLLGGLRW
jgi:hypothetical protein